MSKILDWIFGMDGIDVWIKCVKCNKRYAADLKEDYEETDGCCPGCNTRGSI